MAVARGRLAPGAGALVCSPKVATAAGSQGLCFPCSLGPELCSNQCSLEGKKAPLGHSTAFILTGFLPRPRAQLTNLPSQHHPPSPSPQPNSTVPVPKYLCSYITSKYVLATLKTLVLRKHLVSYLEASGNACSAHCCRQSPSR